MALAEVVLFIYMGCTLSERRWRMEIQGKGVVMGYWIRNVAPSVRVSVYIRTIVASIQVYMRATRGYWSRCVACQ